MFEVRADWLNAFAATVPAWKGIVEKIIAQNGFLAIPASKAWKDGEVEDSDLAVQERGVKGSPPAFRLENGKVACVNYPGSFDPMTEEEFIAYIMRCCAEQPADDSWLEKFLSRP